MSEEKSILEKNMEMWEKFVNSNMDLMFKTMEQALEGSQAFQNQVNKVVSAAVSSQFDVLLNGIMTVERQVETLAEKVEALVEARKE